MEKMNMFVQKPVTKQTDAPALFCTVAHVCLHFDAHLFKMQEKMIFCVKNIVSWAVFGLNAGNGCAIIVPYAINTPLVRIAGGGST